MSPIYGCMRIVGLVVIAIGVSASQGYALGIAAAVFTWLLMPME